MSAGTPRSAYAVVLPTVLIAIAGALAALYWHLGKRVDRARLWPTALGIGVGLGVARATLASAGWYIVEHTGGPLQVPGFALAMTAWPEAALLSQTRLGPAPTEFHVLLSAVLIGSTVAVVSGVALIVELARRTGRSGTDGCTLE